VKPLQQSGLRLPAQDLERCNLFDCNVDAVTGWVEDLPLGSPSRAGALLRTAASELNRVTLTPALRFQLLELLRDPVRSVVRSLERVCLNQPIVLDKDAQIQADLITDLFTLSGAGYTLVAVAAIRGEPLGEGINPAKLAGESLHRAVVAAGHRIRFAYLLYQPMELHLWSNLHQLYALAERQQLARLPVEDPVRERSSTITEEYTPPLLLACSRPNQLRQHDIKGVYRAFQEWASYVDLQDPELGEGTFGVDMQSDQAPLFAELLVRRGNSQFRYINTSRLLPHIEELRSARTTQGIRVIEFDRETRIDANLLEHLGRALGEVSQRNFARQPSRTVLHIAAGLSNVHYFVAGERTLSEIFQAEDEAGTAARSASSNPFLVRDTSEEEGDAAGGGEARPPEDGSEAPVDIDRITRVALEQEGSGAQPVRYLVHSVKTMNTSAGGYCVEWDEPPHDIHIGDVVCVRETDNDSADWTIAVIRWVSQIKHAPTLLGLELVSPRASAYAARVKMTSGDYTRPIRVLLLPDIPLVGQAHTLIVPRMVFREGQRVTVSRNEDGFLVKLKNQVASTGYVSQMDFDYLRQLEEDSATARRGAASRESFDSVWSQI